MAAEIVDLLASAAGGVVVDGTVGGGGHSAALREHVRPALLLGIDRDPAALEAAAERLGGPGAGVRLVRGNYADMGAIVRREGIGDVNGVLLDLGVSSPQLDVPERGFSYRAEAPLDMRMDPDGPLTAADVVNDYPEADLRRVIAAYGEERFAGRVAAAIVRRRARRPFRTTTDLAAVVKEAIPAATRRRGPHPARRTFQALRIEVNGEIDALVRGLDGAVDVLAPGGRIVVLAYHSLEDREVKRRFARGARGCVCPPGLPVCGCGRSGELRLLTRKPLRPSPEEVARNPRADSARLRAAEKSPVARGAAS